METMQAMLQRAHVNSAMLFHAYIISSPVAADSHFLAESIACAAVCTGGAPQPCMHCKHCQKAQNGIHPDIIWIDREKEKAEILVQQVRALRADSPVMPNEAAKKVYIIENADKMNPQAQNAMLNLLEEAPAHVVFLLLAENPGALLPTVRSRCVELTLAVEAAQIADSEQAASAAEFMALIHGANRVTLASKLFELASLDRLQLTAFSAAMKRLAIEQLKTADAKEQRELSLKLLRLFDKIDSDLVYNVNTGHLMGFLLAGLL